MTQFSRSMEGITGSAIRELFGLLAKGDIISFGGGNPSATSFPVAEIRTICDDLLTKNGAAILQYGATEGYAPLREAVAAHMMPQKGLLNTDPATILPTTGSIQGMDLLSRIFIDRGDTVLVEDPTFLGVLQTLNIYGANVVGVNSDDEGVDVEHLEALMKQYRPKMFYCIPTFQNPSGRTIGVERRRRIAELAETYDVIIAEDDPYCDLRYRGDALPPIRLFDTSEHVLLLNSFSKIISPGLRVGCISGNADIIRKLVIAKQGADTHTANLNQAIAAEFLLRGWLPGQIARILPEYARRLDAMLAAMDRYLPDCCAYTRPDGGLFVWGEAKGHNMTALVKRAVDEKKIAYIPGAHFFASPKGHESTFRLNFSGTAFENIEEGIRRLGALIGE